MNYRKLSITELHKAYMNGEITPLDLIKQVIADAKKDDNNAFEYISEKEALEAVSKLDPTKKDNLLWGVPYVLKDNFSSKDIPTTASSKFLEGYIPTFSSETQTRLDEQGAILIGKTTLDELAMGGSGITGHLGKTYNPWDKSHTRMIGGSSCGSAAACSSGLVPLAIGSDTGDSARKPAAYCGIVGFKPTWGRISRYGLFAFAPSLDHVGYFTRNVKDAAITLQVLAGRDDKDPTSSHREVSDYLSSLNRPLKEKRIAVITEILEAVKNEKIRRTYIDLLHKLESEGAVINYVHMDINLCRAIFPTYAILSCAEATSNYAGFDGIKFGKRFPSNNYTNIMFETRTKCFSERIKRRFVIGSYSLLKENQSEIFLKAQKCRRLIVDATNKILEENDAIFLPTAPTVAPLFNGPTKDRLSDEALIADNYLAIANFGGQPSLSLPIGFDNNLPISGNLICKIFDEETLFGLAKRIEDITGLADIIPEEV